MQAPLAAAMGQEVLVSVAVGHEALAAMVRVGLDWGRVERAVVVAMAPAGVARAEAVTWALLEEESSHCIHRMP